MLLLQKLSIFQNGEPLKEWEEDSLEQYNSQINQRVRKLPFNGYTYISIEGAYMVFQDSKPQNCSEYLDTFDETRQFALHKSLQFPQTMFLISRIIEEASWH
ncbi:hypothetical protein [Shimazuella kribbensis]|uniref:hypothetical protein n=1 Tax=Shimazuella kribbensis TaxID=139808 RepID=UPI0003FD87BB|nr:hypothetical protein [Shimazuella kribbensis]